MADKANKRKQGYRRLFPSVSLREKIAWIFTDLAEQDPSYRRVIDPLILYPYVKWTMMGTLVDNVIAVKGKQFYELAKTVANTTVTENTLQLERREKYFDLAVPFVTQMGEVSDWIKMYGQKGKNLYSCMLTVLGETTLQSGSGASLDSRDKPCSAFVLDRYLPELIRILYREKLSEIEECYLPLMDHILESVPEDDSDLYHNVEELLKKYEENRYLNDGAMDFVKQLYGCRTPDEFSEEVTDLGDVISASRMNQYMSIIAAAILSLRDYPVKEQKYYEVAIRMIEHRYVRTSYGLARKTDKTIGKELDLKKGNFSRLKRETLETLGLVLWGVDRSILIKTGILEA